VPTTVIHDHLILAKKGAKSDLAIYSNLRRFCFLSSVSKYGIGFWKPGSGIIHQIVLENYAFQVE
jgi:aconitate hydratase